MPSQAGNRQNVKPGSSPAPIVSSTASNTPHSKTNLRRRAKQLLGALVVIASFAFLAYYWRTHPEIVTQLKSVSPIAVIAIMALYLMMTFVLVGVYDTILRLCAKPIPLGEHTLLTMYSSIINFFGPLQSGPGFRTIYLKQKHDVSAKSYLTGTLLYYALFGLINLVFLLVGAISAAYLPLLIGGLAGGLLVARLPATRVSFLKRFEPALHSPLLIRLALLTFIQAVLVIIIYSIELRAIGAPASLMQVITYAGAGSLALFVSLTPGALGFRESFQYFSQSIHGVDSSAIITANVLDRSVYVSFLILMFLAIVAFHAKSRLQLKQPSGNGRS